MDLEQKILQAIDDVRTDLHSDDVKDDPELIKLLYMKIDRWLTKGTITPTAGVALRYLPKNKLMRGFNAVQKILTEK